MSLTACNTESGLGIGVTIAFSVIYVFLLIAVSLYSFYYLMEFNEKFMKSPFHKKLYLWFIDAYKRRRCYVPVITHLFDQITDIAVVIKFGELASSGVECGGLNMKYLFSASIFVLLFYRTISSFLIFRTTGLWKKFVLQFFDFELFRALHINYLCDKNEPCSPQRWITALEASFESTPQALIQTIYLLKTQSFTSSPIILVSLIASLWTIISKIASDDKSIVKRKARNLNFADERYKTCKCVSWLYVCRILWRIFDVSSRIFICSAIWLSLGGFALIIIISFEWAAVLIICTVTKHWEFLFAVVGIVVSQIQKTAATKLLFAYRTITNLVVMSLITSFVYIESIQCWKCPDHEVRERLLIKSHVGFVIFIYCWISVAVSPFLSLFLAVVAFNDTGSNSRTLEDMIDAEDWQGIIEMLAYSESYGVYDSQTGMTLFLLCVQENYGKMVRYLMKQKGVDLNYTTTTKNDQKCVLDFVGQNMNTSLVMNRRYIGKLLLKIDAEYPHMRNQHGDDALAMAWYIGDLSVVDKIMNRRDQLLKVPQHDFSRLWDLAQQSKQREVIEYFKKRHPTVMVPNIWMNQHRTLMNLQIPLSENDDDAQ
eukprot:481109_1